MYLRYINKRHNNISVIWSTTVIIYNKFIHAFLDVISFKTFKRYVHWIKVSIDEYDTKLIKTLVPQKKLQYLIKETLSCPLEK